MQNTLKLNNKKYIRILLFVILLLSGFDLLMIIGCLTLSFKYKTILLTTDIIFLLGLLIALSVIRIIEFETSGAIISIKRYHPFQKFWQGILIEFPANALHRFSLKGSKLILTIKKDSGELADIFIYLQGMTDTQLHKLHNNLEKIIKYS